jgi:hypothetical protein
MNQDHAAPATGDRARRLDEEMAEVCLLLPAWQVAALERLARGRGLTLGRLLRSLIHDHLMEQADPEPARAGLEPRGAAEGSPGRVCEPGGARDIIDDWEPRRGGGARARPGFRRPSGA